ncbi:MAG: hypothetical protein K2M46_00815 [Lachnospiraceae bacterium]|nr:hypothetical protein [Lachnospiraceae bacterium]
MVSGTVNLSAAGLLSCYPKGYFSGAFGVFEEYAADQAVSLDWITDTFCDMQLYHVAAAEKYP